MPVLTIRAIAELIHLPAYEQMRILAEQKYPRQAPQTFRVPYYLPALRAIRRYYSQHNDTSVLRTARVSIGGEVRNAIRQNHNLRVLQAFQSGQQARRRLIVCPMRHREVRIGSTQIKLNFDLIATEATATRHIFYNCRNAELEPEIARTTIEITAVLMRDLEARLSVQDIEYVDLYTQRVHSVSRPRPATETRMSRNIEIIETLWPTV